MTDLSSRLKKSRIDAGLENAAAGATFCSVPYPTYAGHENGSRGFKVDEARHYAKKYKVSLEWLLTGKKAAPLVSIGTVPVIGKVSAGTWLDIEEIEQRESYDMYSVPASTEYPTEWQYAFEVDGDSINKTAQHGDKLICLDCAKSGLDINSIQDDDLVIIEKTRHDGQMIQRTAKRFRRTSQGFDLWPDSHEPEHQEPIAVNGAENGETIRVMAKVLWILKKP